MAVTYTFPSSTMASRGYAAIRTKLGHISLNWQRARAHRDEVFRVTQELAGCTDRELADLGISRSEIPAVAHGTYRRA